MKIWENLFRIDLSMESSNWVERLVTDTRLKINSQTNDPVIRGFIVAIITSSEGLPGVLGNKGTWPFTFREQGIFLNNV